MSTSIEWVEATESVTWMVPGDVDDSHGNTNQRPVITIGDATVVEGTKEELVAFAKRVLAVAESIDWVEVSEFIDLSIRNNEQGYVDSMKLIFTTIKGRLGTAHQDKIGELSRRLTSDLITIEDSGYDLDTMHDTLLEWEEVAEEYDLYAYADGEAGVYRVTNVPEEN